MLALLEEAAWQIPLPLVGRTGATREQDAAVAGVDDGARGGLRVCIADEAAGRAVDAAVPRAELRTAAGTPSPRMEHAHSATIDA